ncbi:MAG TPA: hypothetical protein DHV77_10905 [Erysipelotrichaceae bacterium]|nr:hypothetical protein [Erysipelotrichaceae bacterium]
MKHVFLLKSEGTTHSFLPTIHKIMKGYDYDIHISQYPNHVISIMKEYRTPVRVYAVGGDGFMNQVVQALVHTKHEMVVIPYGTGNDFSRYVNNGVKKAEDVLRESLQWHAQRIDTVKMNDLYYINSGCFGIDAAIANHVHDVVNVPFIPESKSYILSILRNIKS